MWEILNFLEKSEDDFIFSIETESGGSDEKLSYIGSSLTRVGIKREERVKFGDLLRWEDWIFGSDVFAKDCFEFFIEDIFSWSHDIF